MNPLEQQSDILNKLAQIIHDEAGDGYELAACEYEFLPLYNTISSSFLVRREGQNCALEMAPGIPSMNAELAFNLRKLMKDHTGGEWTSFTLELDAQGQARTKFTYPKP